MPSNAAGSADLIYVPGLLRCKKCGFELSKRVLNMAAGTVGANNDPDVCPNDGSPMWRVSEREYREELFDHLLGIRNETLDVAARICREQIEPMNKRGRLQARAILEDCANAIEERKTEAGTPPSVVVSERPFIQTQHNQGAVMENQHRQITGYRELTQAEIDLMNMVKGLAAKAGAELEIVNSNPETDKRWVAIARTHLQEGFMALTRAIAKPITF